MQQQLNQVAVDKMEKDADLIDCYRIALDFGMPAALKAYEKLVLESMLDPATTNADID